MIVPGSYISNPRTSYWVTAAHELGHSLGLRDIYTVGEMSLNDPPDNWVGYWDIMNGVFRSTYKFLGWFRHALGWLDDSRKMYLTKGQWTGDLKPFSKTSGISMVVIPQGNPQKPNKMWVVEVAEKGRKETDDGVLVYTIFDNLELGAKYRKVNVNIKHDMSLRDYVNENNRTLRLQKEYEQVAAELKKQGANATQALKQKVSDLDNDLNVALFRLEKKMSLYNAPLKVGEIFKDESDMPMTVRVNKKNSDGSFNVTIRVK